MEKNKQFLIKVIVTILFITLANFMIYSNYKDSFTGDLGRLGKIDFGQEYDRQFEGTLEKEKYFSDSNKLKENYDVIAIGDSFSQQEKYGYQNYLSKISGKEIMNLKRYDNGRSEPEQTAFLLLNSGYFDEYKPKYLIIESVERAFLPRGINIDLEKKEELNKIYSYYENLKEEGALTEKSFFNIDNLKFLVNKILYKINDRAFYTVVYKKKLKEEMFSLKEKELYFYYDDINNLKYNTKENMELTNKNLNALYERLKEKDIELIVMPAVNKYTLYQDYIKDNKYKKSYFFEEYENQNKKYIFINTKKILENEISKGEKDIFYLHDTHWSHKASKAIAEELNKVIR